VLEVVNGDAISRDISRPQWSMPCDVSYRSVLYVKDGAEADTVAAVIHAPTAIVDALERTVLRPGNR
jgi:hypothetical protein